jgi:hypothetical protein
MRSIESSDLIGTQRARIGGFRDQSADIVEQSADLRQSAVGRADDLVGPFVVRNGALRAGDVTSQHFAGDQTGRIVFAVVDSQTRA